MRRRIDYAKNAASGHKKAPSAQHSPSVSVLFFCEKCFYSILWILILKFVAASNFFPVFRVTNKNIIFVLAD